MTIYAIVGISIISVFFVLDIVLLAINVKELSQKTIHGLGNWRGTAQVLSLLICLAGLKDIGFNPNYQTLTNVLLYLGVVLMFSAYSFWLNYEKIIVGEAGFYYRRKGRMVWMDFKDIGNVIYDHPPGYIPFLEVYDSKNNILTHIHWPNHVEYFLSAKDDYFKNHPVAECPPQFVAEKNPSLFSNFLLLFSVIAFYDIMAIAIAPIAWMEYTEVDPLIFWTSISLVIAALTGLSVALAVFLAKFFYQDYIEFDGETLFFGRKKHQPYKVEDLLYDIKVHKKSKRKKITIRDKKTDALLFKAQGMTISNSHLLIKLLQSSSLNQH